MLAANLAFSLLATHSLALMWNMINVLQLIVFTAMLDLKFPANLDSFFKMILDIMTFQFVDFSEFLQNLFSLHYNYEAPSDRLEQFGFETSNFILNAGSLIIYIMGCLAVYIAILLLVPLKKKNKKIEKGWSYLVRVFWLSFLIRLVMEGSLELLVASMLNINSTEQRNAGEWISLLAAYAFIAIIMVVPLIVPIIHKIKGENFLKRKDVKLTFGSLYEEFKSSQFARLYYLFFVLRRGLLVVLILGLKSYPSIQVILFSLTSLWSTMYIGMVKPFKDSKTNT